eukprot:2684003-Rhodomonas_salina.1
MVYGRVCLLSVPGTAWHFVLSHGKYGSAAAGVGQYLVQFDSTESDRALCGSDHGTVEAQNHVQSV